MRIYIPLYQFILIAISTALETYFFNDALMNGQYIIAAFWGVLLLRNLRASYQLGKFIRLIESQKPKK